VRILKNGISDTKKLAYTSLARHIIEYVAVCWDPYREVLNWETFAQLRKIARICLSSKHTRENGLGRLKVIDYKGHAI
jgi:hypothetical protein